MTRIKGKVMTTKKKDNKKNEETKKKKNKKKNDRRCWIFFLIFKLIKQFSLLIFIFDISKDLYPLIFLYGYFDFI